MAAGNRVFTTRIVGGAGVALAASVIVQNAMFVGGVAQLLGLGDGTGAPTYGAPLGEVLAYHAENRGGVAVSLGLGALNLPLLLPTRLRSSSRDRCGARWDVGRALWLTRRTPILGWRLQTASAPIADHASLCGTLPARARGWPAHLRCYGLWRQSWYDQGMS